MVGNCLQNTVIETESAVEKTDIFIEEDTTYQAINKEQRRKQRLRRLKK